MTDLLAGYLSEEKLLELLEVKKSTLDERIRSGTNHPPFITLERKRYFPIDLFQEWLRSRPVRHEVAMGRVRRAG